MKTTTSRSKSLLSLALVSGLGLGAASPAAFACTSEPIISSICVMAFSPSRFQSFNQTYMLAAGQTLPINQYTALFALIGVTFGGNGSSTFNLPDLRGKVIVGYDNRDASFMYGATGGSTSVSLSVAQLPPHAFTLSNVPVTLNNIQAATTLTGLAATANLSGVVLTGAATGLTMKVASTTNGRNTPVNNYLGKANGTAGNLYSDQAPDATLNGNAIGGQLTMTLGSNITAPVAITGAAATVVTGGGSASGNTNVLGSGVPIPVMQPYLVLPYYIAITGIYPSMD